MSLSSPLEAYIAGLVASDGYVTSCGGVEISMKHSDVKELFPELARQYGGVVRVGRVHHSRTQMDVLKLDHGLPEWKIARPLMRGYLEPHYARGLVDGDGCLRWQRPAKPAIVFTFNSVEWWIGEYFRSFLERQSLRYSEIKRGMVIDLSVRAIEDAKRLAAVLYADAVALSLPRKYDLAMRFQACRKANRWDNQ